MITNAVRVTMFRAFGYDDAVLSVDYPSPLHQRGIKNLSLVFVEFATAVGEFRAHCDAQACFIVEGAAMELTNSHSLITIVIP